MLQLYHLVHQIQKLLCGDTISVTVSFGQKVASADVTVSFDNSKFSYSSISVGNANNIGSSVKVSYFDSTGGSNAISSITFKFKSKATGSASFSAKCVWVSDGSDAYDWEFKVTKCTSDSLETIDSYEKTRVFVRK